MAVYTSLSSTDISDLLEDFSLGELVDFKGIEGGIENTNYFISLNNDGEAAEYVLTIFEELSMEELPYFVELCQWLAKKGVAVPYAIQDKNGIGLKKLKNKPAIIQPRFMGTHVDQTALTPAHCAAIGKALGEFHTAGKDFYLERQAHRGVFWWRRESTVIAPKLTQDDAALLKDEVDQFDALRDNPGNIEMGTVHGDLFHDNALFDGTEINAILDVYNAATAYLLYDLAIVANDWCTNADGTVDNEREQALLGAYASARPFTSDEYAAWPTLTCTAAMRFWLSRLIPWLDESSTQKLKDPAELKRILQYRRAHPSQLPK